MSEGIVIMLLVGFSIVFVQWSVAVVELYSGIAKTKGRFLFRLVPFSFLVIGLYRLCVNGKNEWKKLKW